MNDLPTFLDAGPEGYETRRFSSLVWRQSSTLKCQQELNRDTSDEDEDSEKDKLKVFLRLRPLIGNEKGTYGPFRIKDNGRKLLVEHEEAALQKSVLAGDVFQKFIFSKILTESSSQEDVYNTCVSDSVASFMEGSDVLLFCYGATNAGKTYTIQGSGSNPGIIPRAVREIFSGIEGTQCGETMLKPDVHDRLIKLDHKENRNELNGVSSFLRSHTERQRKLKGSFNSSVKSTTSSSDFVMSSTLLSGESGKSLARFGDVSKVLNALDEMDNGNSSELVHYVWLSCIEVYNERVSDLLVTYEHKKPRRMLKLVKDPRKGTTSVSGVKYLYVRNAEEALSVMAAAAENISFASTRMNERSSRSHCLFSLKVVKDSREPSLLYPRMTTITFCDLAGSERTGKTGNEGVRLKETGAINTSLMVLRRCIQALRDTQKGNEKRKVVVPYRESKLTQLLQSYFEGGGKVSMLVNVCPSSLVLEETLQVLKFSAIAQKIVTIAKEKEVVPVRDSKPSMFSQRLSRFTGGKTSITWATPFKSRASTISISPNDEVEVLEDLNEEDEEEETANKIDEWIHYANLLEERIKQMKKDMKKNDEDTRAELLSFFNKKIKEMSERHREQIDDMHDRAETLTHEKLIAYERAQEEYQREKRERGEEDAEELLEKLKVKDKENQDLLGENEEIKKENKDFKKTIMKLCNEQQAYKQEKMELQFTISTLKSNLKQFQETDELDSKLLEENQKLEKELLEATDKYLSMKARIEATEEEIRQNTKYIYELRNDNVKLTQETETLQEQARGNTNTIEDYESRTARMEEEIKKLKIKNAVLEKELKYVRDEQAARQNEDMRLKSKQHLQHVREAAERSPSSPKGGITTEMKDNLLKAKKEIEKLNGILIIRNKEIEAFRRAREADQKCNELKELDFQRAKEILEEKQKLVKSLAREIEILKEKDAVKITKAVVNPFSEASTNSNTSTKGRSKRGHKQTRKGNSPPRTRSRQKGGAKENLDPSLLSEDDFVERPKPAPRSRKLLDTYLPRFTGDESVTEEKKRNLRPRK